MCNLIKKELELFAKFTQFINILKEFQRQTDNLFLLKKFINICIIIFYIFNILYLYY